MSPRVATAGLALAVAATGVAVSACNPYAPTSGLKHTAVTACSGYWEEHILYDRYGRPYGWSKPVWINTDRRPTC